MTEAEWLASTEPGPMLEFLRDRASERQLRLLTCGFARHIPAEYLIEEIVTCFRHAEAFADGTLPLEVLNAFRDTRTISFQQNEFLYYTQRICNLVLSTKKLVWQSAQEQSALTVRLRIEKVLGRYQPEQKESWQMATRSERLLITALIRDLFGSQLFRPAYIEPAWLTTTVVGLAEGVYADRAFDRLPILADALEEAGCDDADILAHCRGDGPHVRGCWVVDLLLGKE
jgi:hypothetical protein